ncbi:MAG TPA: glutamine synthetase type III, partial [Anaerolineae bacterium]|nr:glutamine synthetase type III [Anaerolineae bacterium]
AGVRANNAVLQRVTDLTDCLEESVTELEDAMDHSGDDLLAEAAHLRDVVVPAMSQVRSYADELEGVVADDLWPLPTYQEMLFIK